MPVLCPLSLYEIQQVDAVYSYLYLLSTWVDESLSVRTREKIKCA